MDKASTSQRSIQGPRFSKIKNKQTHLPLSHPKASECDDLFVCFLLLLKLAGKRKTQENQNVSSFLNSPGLILTVTGSPSFSPTSAVTLTPYETPTIRSLRSRVVWFPGMSRTSSVCADMT